MQTTQSMKMANLYVVSTPIGNLGDITERAVQVLHQVDLICCEDTRHSARLLENIGCKKPLMSLHEHNERDRSSVIVEKLRAGQSIALVSDAGTPLISDPGYVLVNEVIAAGLRVIPVPGASAVITALSVSGLPTDRWVFEGFLPHKQGARIKALEAVAEMTQTLVFYESSHRIEDSLEDMVSVFGGHRSACVARELTKTFETVLRGALADLVLLVKEDSNQRKGEFVVMVAGAQKASGEQVNPDILALAKELKPLLPPKKAAAVIANVYGGAKKSYYELILSL
ncbi:16S rRNA (cytidine(1402)-2'-O)-methyltransferase [Reinekea sp. G2M2-21]|uniref:16S rRNA (cytidine(1402)-2'-O)-methyltransferase n=1 Tax=Reinekea sp. G2M2-21 TaxID=2788942 RepID=UPI001E4DA925|nr:16S rRNA (cytidine(1402)-2'-O)-methyltransferase [Reinekea sp. G2M2-21]